MRETNQNTSFEFSSRLASWLARLLMASLLMLGGEVLLWPDILTHTVGTWLRLLAGYTVLGAVVLDLMVRGRVRDITGVMLVIAIYALGAGVLLHPSLALVDFPRTLLTRVLGAQTVAGTAGIVLFFALLGYRRGRSWMLLAIFAVVAGLGWGVWLRWMPESATWITLEASIVQMFSALAIIVAVIAVIRFWLGRYGTNLKATDLELSPLEGTLLAIVAALLAGFHPDGRFYSPDTITITVSLAVVILVVLVIQRVYVGQTLLDRHMPPIQLGLPWLAAVTGIFIVLALVGYNLPEIPIGDSNQIVLLESGFMLVGFLWLPLTMAAIGFRLMAQVSSSQG